MTDIMGRAWLLRGLLLALLVTAGPAELEGKNNNEENAFGMFVVPTKMEQPSKTTPATTSPATAWPSPPISATKAPSPTAATTPGTTSATSTTTEGVTKNPLLRMMLEAKLKVLKRREMVAEIGKMAGEEEERRSQKKLASALRRMGESEDLNQEEERRSRSLKKLAAELPFLSAEELILMMEQREEDEEDGPKMEERSIDRIDDDGGGMFDARFDGSPLQSAMNEFFRTSTPEPLLREGDNGAEATTPAPFTLADNTILGLNSTAPLRFGNRKLIAVTERSAAKINYGSLMENACIIEGFDGFSAWKVSSCPKKLCERLIPAGYGRTVQKSLLNRAGVSATANCAVTHPFHRSK